MLAAFTDATAPAERLAAFRIVTGVFSLTYLAVRLPVFVDLGNRSDVSFDGVGVLAPLSSTVPGALVVATIVVAAVAGIASTIGFTFRLTGPVFAVAMLLLTTYRGSFGQLLHFENLMVLHLLVVALSPAADAWSLDARRRDRGATVRAGGSPDRPRGKPVSNGADESVAYGWPLALAGLIVVVSYVITGIAKLRYGGFDWVLGDTLRNHVAYSAARLDLLGGTPSPIARHIVGHEWLFPPMAAATVLLELAAPVAFARGRVRDAWVAAIWTMHVAIFAFMLVGFPYPLFGVAFTPFYRLERLLRVPARFVATSLRTSA